MMRIGDKRIFGMYLVCFVLLTIGITYALVTDSLILNTTTAMIGIDESAYGSTTFDSSNLEFKPIIDSTVGSDSSENNVIKIDFEVGGSQTNNASDPVIYDIALNDLELNCSLLSPYIKWRLLKNDTQISEGSLDYKQGYVIEDNRLLLTTIQQDLPEYDESRESYDEYTFYMWFSDSCQSDLATCKANNQLVDQSALLGQNLSGKVEVELYTGSKQELVRTSQDTYDSSVCFSEYMVDFDLMGGTLDEGQTSMTVVNNQAYGTLPTPTKEDTIITYDANGGTLEAGITNPSTIEWDFDGWYKEKSFNTVVTNETEVTNTQNHTLYAKWTTDSDAVLPSASRTGYRFVGWYTQAEGGIKVNSISEKIESATLYAHWIIDESNMYMVSFNYNGGSGATSSKEVVYGDVYGELPTPVKSSVTVTYNTVGGTLESGRSDIDAINFEFGGWYKENSFANVVTSDTVVEDSHDHWLYAKWSSSDITLPGVTKEGYTFDGWYKDEAYTQPVGTTGDKYTIDSNKTLYAKWLANSYTVTVEAGHGVSSLAASGWTGTGTATISKSFEYGEQINLSEVMTATFKDGYRDGKYDITNGSGTISDEDVFTVGAGNVTITANATTLVAPSLSISTSSTTKVYGSSSTTLTASQTISYDSGVTVYYAFGYSTTSTGTYTYGSFSTSNTTIISSTSHYGTRHYRVKAYASDGTLTSETIISPSKYITLRGAKITLNTNNCGTIASGTNPFYAKYNTANTYTTTTGSTAATVPTFAANEGYSFNGWYTATSGGSKVLTVDGALTGTGVSGYTSTNKWVATADKTLYAQCSLETYTITYNANGGSGAPSSQTKTFGTNLKLSTIEPVRDKYEFLGWHTSSTATTALYEPGGDYTANESKTLYAVWAEAYVECSTSSEAITYYANFSNATSKAIAKNLSFNTCTLIKSLDEANANVSFPGSSVTIDLNTNTLTGSLVNSSQSPLILKNGTIQATKDSSSFPVINHAQMLIESGTYKTSTKHATIVSGDGSGVSLEIAGGTFINDCAEDICVSEHNYVVVSKGSSTLNITGGDFQLTSSTTNGSAFHINGNAYLTGGEITSNVHGITNSGNTIIDGISIKKSSIGLLNYGDTAVAKIYGIELTGSKSIDNGSGGEVYLYDVATSAIPGTIEGLVYRLWKSSSDENVVGVGIINPSNAIVKCPSWTNDGDQSDLQNYDAEKMSAAAGESIYYCRFDKSKHDSATGEYITDFYSNTTYSSSYFEGRVYWYWDFPK